MEEILIVVIQFLIESLLEIGSSLFWYDDGLIDWPDPDSPLHPFWRAVFWLGAGGVLAWVSLQLWPKSLISHASVRIANLVLTPFAAGCAGRAVVVWRSRHDDREPSGGFARSFCFTLGMVLIRFVYARHA